MERILNIKSLITTLLFVFFITTIQAQNIIIKPASISKSNSYIIKYSKYYIGKYHDIKIMVYKKKLDLINDLDDWYNSGNLREIYSNLLKGKIEEYGFSDSSLYRKIGDILIADYVTFSMFEACDIRMERDIVLFKNKDIYIAILKYDDDIKILETILLNNNRLIYRQNSSSNTKEIIWNYDNGEPKKTINELVNGKCNISIVNSWYKGTNEIFDDLVLYIKNNKL
jgi:hypothetical protein